MAKKLTQQQHRQIRENQQKHLQTYEQDKGPASDLLPARVITNYGKSIIAELSDKQLIRCLPRQNLEQIVCGDNVLIQIQDNGDAVVAAIQARDSLLQKPGFGGKLKPMAANIDQVVIVMAVQPVPNTYLIDRYLVATENLHANGLILLNKMDLAGSKSILTSLHEEYEKLGYQVVPTSISDDESMHSLNQRLNHKTSILVGLSGVGKSALIKTLLPDQNIRVGEVSAASGEGTHTTTGSILYHLPAGGDIIDSPGVRDFGLWNTTADDVFYGFVELRNHAGHCKFSDCRHDIEPDCAIKDAYASGEISEQRYKHYKKIIQEYSS